MQVEQRSELVDMVALLAKSEAKAEREAALQGQGALQEGLPQDGAGGAQWDSSRSSAAEALKEVGIWHRDYEAEIDVLPQHMFSGAALQLRLRHAAPGQNMSQVNISSVAQAAVDIAATALNTALLSAEQTVEKTQQKPEVGSMWKLCISGSSLCERLCTEFRWLCGLGRLLRSLELSQMKQMSSWMGGKQ